VPIISSPTSQHPSGGRIDPDPSGLLPPLGDEPLGGGELAGGDEPLGGDDALPLGGDEAEPLGGDEPLPGTDSLPLGGVESLGLESLGSDASLGVEKLRESGSDSLKPPQLMQSPDGG
jgi:hypothetical protein